MTYNHKALMSHFSIKCYYSKGMTVFQENDLCDRIGFVHTGQLKLTHYTGLGEENILAILNKNDLFGDFLINSLHPYFPGNLVATEDTEVAFLDKHRINSLIKNNDDFRIYFLNQLSEKSLELNFHNKILMQSSLREKILMWLNQKSIEYKTKEIPIDSKEQLANYFNVARPSLSREFSTMKKSGLIDYDRYSIHILY